MAKPTKYKPEYCDKLLNHCKSGFDISSFGATIGVRKSTVYEWIKKYEDFASAHEMGKAFLQMKCIERLQDFADGNVEGKASVIAAIYLAKVYGIRDDAPLITTDRVEDKNVIKIAYKLDKPLELEDDDEEDLPKVKKDVIIEAEIVSETKKEENNG